ncbi:MAG: acetyltransferase [Arcicella sp.]|nr:acetyltransferase [Arcicella sp.]
MEIEKLTILGLSESTLTMIFDNLESCMLFPEIKIVNNLVLNKLKSFENPLFEISLIPTVENSDCISKSFLGVYKPQSKLTVFKHFESINSDFINIINKTASISSTVKLGVGINVNSLVSVAAFTQIGNFVSINRNASIGHHSKINDFVTINPGANIAGFVKIGRNTLIGMGVNIIDGISVGENSIIGAGSLVTKNIPDGVVAYGNPCKIIRKNEIF